MTTTDSLRTDHSIVVPIEDEVRRSYLDYAMSVIVSRAIPDVRDGLKPVHRRIIYGMYESGCHQNKPYRKSARIVGDVMGKYHPHGDAAIYDALVRMAQPFSLRLPLIDGQGNFGSMDGDSPAAMRYTESRMDLAAHRLIEDIDKATVDFQPNYDGSEREPVVLPAGFPNLLVNGSGGIAVGMATNIPPHNLGEVVDACLLYADDHQVGDEALLECVQGPDFPTGGIILGKSGVRQALLTGRGSVMIRGKTEIEELPSGRTAIIITEMPYQVNKARMVERIADLVREKKIEGISDLRDESNKKGVRVVVEIKRDAVADVVLSQLYSFTPLQTSFGVNCLALDQGRPKQMSLRDVISAFVHFREEVITKRTVYLLGKARDRAHLLIGLSIAVANIDEVIALIKAASDPVEARVQLMARRWEAAMVAPMIALVDSSANVIQNGTCLLTETQARAILDMRLHRLTGLEHQKLRDELDAIIEEIKGYMEILGSRARLLEVLREELLKVKEEFASPRRTAIVVGEFEHDIEDLIQKEDMVVTVTVGGYIKRVPLATYRAQRHGGKGRSGITMKDEDATTEVLITNTHMPVLFFSSLGKVYKLKVYRLPLGSPQARGRALVNIFPLGPGETINHVMSLPENEEEWDNLHIMFSTANGNARRNSLADFRSIQSNGKIAMKLDEDDRLVGVALCTENDHILLATSDGKAVRFSVEAVRVFKGRTSDGVRGVRLADKDKVISMTVLHGAEAEMEQRDAFLKLPLELRQSIKYAETVPAIADQLAAENCVLSEETVIAMAQAEEFLLTVTENGYGKRTSLYEYRITNRGGSGVVNIITSERNGKVISSFPVEDQDQVMLMTNRGKLIRFPIASIRVIGRNTQGVTLFKTEPGEMVVSAARIPMSDTEDAAEEADTSEPQVNV
jgi:DNA gyrase subunit A